MEYRNVSTSLVFTIPESIEDIARMLFPGAKKETDKKTNRTPIMIK
jgi:hypothetical protein